MNRPINRWMLGCLVSSLFLFAAKPERQWEPGKVGDSVAAATQLGTEPASAAPHHHIDYDPHVVVIQGRDFVYTAEERHAWHGWCMLIVGDQIKYAKDPQGLHVRDASGKECTFAVIDERKRQ